MLTSFSKLYSFIINATILAFGTLFTGFCCLLVFLFFKNIEWYIPFFIFGIIVSVLVGSYLYVLLTIPFQLPKKFDNIKNKVALGEYTNLQQFQEEVAHFMVSFFNFLGADIIGGKFHFTECKSIIIECEVDFSAISEKDFRNNRLRINGQHKAFHLPIQLGSENLGYMVLVTKGYTLPMFYSMLEDFENYYLDDQIKHFVK